MINSRPYSAKPKGSKCLGPLEERGELFGFALQVWYWSCYYEESCWVNQWLVCHSRYGSTHWYIMQFVMWSLIDYLKSPKIKQTIHSSKCTILNLKPIRHEMLIKCWYKVCVYVSCLLGIPCQVQYQYEWLCFSSWLCLAAVNVLSSGLATEVKHPYTWRLSVVKLRPAVEPRTDFKGFVEFCINLR